MTTAFDHRRSACGAGPARRPHRPGSDNPLRVGPGARLIGLIALAFSALYFSSDVLEAMQGRFSDIQLWLTLMAEAVVPVFVVGLAVVQRPRLERFGEFSALAYAYSFVFFTGTVVYALVNDTKDYGTLTHELGALMLIHGAVMVIAGTGFGLAVLRARLLPTWTAVAVIVGVVLVALAQSMPASMQLIAAGVRDLGFAGMGAALLTTAQRDRAGGPPGQTITRTAIRRYGPPRAPSSP